MPDPVKRRYIAPRRREQAEMNRRAILEAAHELFTTRGYRETSVAEIARRAGVSIDTLYEAVGRKPELLLAVHDLVLGDMQLGETSVPLVADDRQYVKAIQAEPTAAGKLRTYADALGRLLPQVAPLSNALRDAGSDDPACRRLSASLDERRAANMRRLAQGLRGDRRAARGCHRRRRRRPALVDEQHRVLTACWPSEAGPANDTRGCSRTSGPGPCWRRGTTRRHDDVSAGAAPRGCHQRSRNQRA